MSDDATASAQDARVVDVHAHVLPQVLVPPGERLTVGGRALPSYPRALSDLDVRLREMDGAGIDVQVVSPWIELAPRGLSTEAAVDHVRRVNDALAEEVARAPERLVGMAMVPQQDGEAAAVELERAVTDLGMCGALLTTSGVGPSLADRSLEPVWETASRRRALLMTHPLQPAEAIRCRAEDIGDLVGTPVEGTIAVAGLMRAGVLDRHPGVRLCVVHGGGALPVLAGRLEALWDLTGPPPGSARPSQLIAKLYVDTLTHDDRALRWLREVVGGHRLLLGSDFPFPTGERRPVERVHGLGLDGAETAAILGGTLRALLRDVDHGCS